MSLEINGEVIEDKVIQHELNYIKQRYQNFNNSTMANEKSIPSDKELVALVKENLSRKTVLRQEAEKISINVSASAIKIEIEKYKKKNPNLNSENQKKLKDYLIQQAKINHLINGIVQDIKQPSQEHLKIFFQENQKNYFISKGFDFIEIGVGKPSTQEKDFKKKFTLFRNNFIHEKGYSQQIKSVLGETSYSKEWKLFPENYLNPLTSKKLNQLKVNQTTSINEEKNAYYFLYLEKVYNNFHPSFQQVEKRVKNDLIFELEERKIDIYVQKLLEKSKIIDNSYL